MVEFLGHILTPDGLCPNPERVSADQKFPRPTTVTGVRQFLGLASYYRRFVKGFAKIAESLHTWTRANSRFVWTTDCQTAFDTLKSKLLMAPVLSFPDFSKDFILEVNASVQGLGAVSFLRRGRMERHTQWHTLVELCHLKNNGIQ